MALLLEMPHRLFAACRQSCHQRGATSKKKVRMDRIWPRRSGLLIPDSTGVDLEKQQPKLLYTSSQAPLHPPLRPTAPTEKILGRAGDHGGERPTLNAGKRARLL
jgi:hypothetical protein